MAHPLSLELLKDEIPALSEIPLFGNAPPFDWDSFGSHLASRFQIPSLKLRVTKQEWGKKELVDRQKNEWSKDREGMVKCLFSPLASPLYFYVPREDREKIVSSFLAPLSEDPLAEPLREGFFRFLLLEALDGLLHQEPFESFTPLIEENFPEEEEGFLLQLEIELQTKKAWGFLFLPSSFRAAWRSHFTQFPPRSVSPTQAEKIFLSLSVKKASLWLGGEELAHLKGGDFLPLPKGPMLLCLGKINLFSASIEREGIRLIDSIYIQEGSMEQQEQEGVDLRDLPVQITVEAARIKMSLGELIQLQPGNVLKLPTPLEQGVSLTVEGKTIGRGELVSLGETLGVRILEIHA